MRCLPGELDEEEMLQIAIQRGLPTRRNRGDPADLTSSAPELPVSTVSPNSQPSSLPVTSTDSLSRRGRGWAGSASLAATEELRKGSDRRSPSGSPVPVSRIPSAKNRSALPKPLSARGSPKSSSSAGAGDVLDGCGGDASGSADAALTRRNQRRFPTAIQASGAKTMYCRGSFGSRASDNVSKRTSTSGGAGALPTPSTGTTNNVITTFRGDGGSGGSGDFVPASISVPVRMRSGAKSTSPPPKTREAFGRPVRAQRSVSPPGKSVVGNLRRPVSPTGSLSRPIVTDSPFRPLSVSSPAGAGAVRNKMSPAPSRSPKSDNIKVCMRIRPLSAQEIVENERACVCKGPQSTVMVSVPASHKTSNPPICAFDWVLGTEATQERVYEELGQKMVQGVADGFHGCVLAYGQTGAGKSHTIFGGSDDARGLLPRLAEGLFTDMRLGAADYLVKVSYLEIYNEKVRDLLTPGGASGSLAPSLEIRQHPEIGVFVEGLTHNVANAPEDVLHLIDFGHKIRVVGATNLNAVSSRSHAVVTVHVERTSLEGGIRRIRRAQLHAVDLAGSERLEHAGIVEARQKESKEINKSLSALSLMISRLASRDKDAKHQHIPYRSSKLTHLLSEALMGNCRTVLLACISPAESALAMTESTLHFASSAKKIRTMPIKNEDVNGCLVDSLRAEIETLREMLSRLGSDQKQDVMDRMVTAQLLHAQFSPTKEELQAQSQAFECRRNQVLENLGLSRHQLCSSLAKGETLSIREDADPYLVNVCVDPLLSGCLVYPLESGRMLLVGSDPGCAIHVEGLGIQPEMCSLICQDGVSVELKLSIVTGALSRKSSTMSNKTNRSLYKGSSSQVFVNNQLVTSDMQLHSKDRLRVGSAHVFQLFIPQEGKKGGNGPRLTMVVDKMVGSTDSISKHRLAQEFASDLRDRIGKDRTLVALTNLEDLQTLVDEANEITSELRGGEWCELEFQAQLLQDVASVDSDPDAVVALYCFERLSLVEPIAGARCRGSRTLRALFSFPQFRRRLEALRDVYHEVEAREEPWGISGDLDPWNVHEGVPRLLTKNSSYTSEKRPSELPSWGTLMPVDASALPDVCVVQGGKDSESVIPQEDENDLRLATFAQNAKPRRRKGLNSML